MVFCFFILLFIFTPILYFFIILYFIIILSYFIWFFFYFVFYYLMSIYIKDINYEKVIKYEFPDDFKEDRNNLLIILLIFFDLAKKQSFMFLYFLLKKNTFNKLPFFTILISFLLIILFYLVVGFNVKIIKITCSFLDVVFKNLKKKDKNFTIKTENIFIDFIFLYNDFYNNFVKKSKIIIKNGTYINNPKTKTEILLNILKTKCNFTNKELITVIECIDILKQNSSIQYNVLRTTLNNNNNIDLFLGENSDFWIGKKTPHTSLMLPYNINKTLMIRETTKAQVMYKKDIDGLKLGDWFKTDLPGIGSINQEIIARKTPPILTENENIVQMNNKKLLLNLRKGLVDKDNFITQLISSFHKLLHTYEKGNLYKDTHYLSLHKKIISDSSNELDKNKVLNSLQKLSEIWHNHFYMFMGINNENTLLTVTQFIIKDTNFIIDDELINMIFET